MGVAKNLLQVQGVHKNEEHQAQVRDHVHVHQGSHVHAPSLRTLLCTEPLVCQPFRWPQVFDYCPEGQNPPLASVHGSVLGGGVADVHGSCTCTVLTG